MKKVVFTFSTQEQADSAVLALSNGYRVEQRYLPVNNTMKPYCVGVFVSKEDIREVENKSSFDLFQPKE